MLHHKKIPLWMDLSKLGKSNVYKKMPIVR